MNNQALTHWWKGYVTIQLKGKKLERLINRMMNKRFSAWDIRTKGEGMAELSITIQDFFHLRPLLKQTGCKAKVIHRRGFPFWVKRTKRRSGVLIGLFSFCLILYMLSTMIWFVDIEGVSTPEYEEAIREELAELGVAPGKFKFQVPEYNKIQRKIMQVMPNTTWVGFTFDGTIARVEVVEKTLPNVQDSSSPKHIIAKKKAVIYDIFVEKGKPMVKPNQFVQPGDLLISGNLGTEEEPLNVSAKGKVLGEVWYEGSFQVPLIQKQEVLTGDHSKKYYIQLGDMALHLWGFKEWH